MPRISSRQKGKNGELELAKFLRDHGYPDAYRGVQYHGGADSPDVVCPGLEDLHIECKRTEAGSLYNWLKQAKRDMGPGKTPVVMHRRSREDWVAILPLEDFIAMQLLKGL